MKLLFVAALIAVSSAARLDHLERSYLPPDQGSQGSFGSRGTFGSQAQANSFGSNFGSPAKSGSAFRSGAFNGATLNQYLPPNQGPSGGNFGSQGTAGPQRFPSQQYGAPQFGAQSQGFSQGSHLGHSQPSSFGGQSHGFNGGHSQSQFGQFQNSQPGHQGSQPGHQGSQFGHQGSQLGHQGSQFGHQGSQFSGSRYNQGPSSQYGAPSQFGAANGGSSSASTGFGGSGSFKQQNSQFGASAASRQYLAPKTSSFQNIPQQSFDEETGYHY